MTEPVTQIPSVSRMVHYVSHGTPLRADGTQAYESVCRAAVITAVHNDYETTVDLCVLNPSGLFFNDHCAYSTEHVGGTWHWPERV